MNAPDGPTPLESYRIVREELSDRRTTLADLDPEIVRRARAYAARAHQKWPPRPAPEPGWTYRLVRFEP